MAPEVDVETLRLLVAIEELGSIAQAARRIGISQPSASARMREFETRWRLEILSRSTRGSELTQSGQAVMAWARIVLHEIDLMRAGLAALAHQQQTSMAVAASLTVAEFLLPRWLGELRTRRPDIHPRMRVVNSDTVIEMVRDRRVELGFIEATAFPADLHRRVVGRDRLAIVVPPEHPWALRSTPLTIEALRAAEYVLREQGSGTRSTFEAALGDLPRVALEADSTQALVGAVRAGMGPAVVSRRAVMHEIEFGHLVEVSHDLDLRRPLTAIWSPSHPLVEVVRELVRIARTSDQEAR